MNTYQILLVAGSMLFVFIVAIVPISRFGLGKRKVLATIRTTLDDMDVLFDEFMRLVTARPLEVVPGEAKGTKHLIAEAGPREQHPSLNGTIRSTHVTLDGKGNWKIEVDDADEMIKVYLTKLQATVYMFSVQDQFKGVIQQAVHEAVKFTIRHGTAIPETAISRKKEILFGMIKVHGNISISEAASNLALTPRQLKTLIYALVGEGKVSGKFITENTFKIESDLENFVAELDKQFTIWKEDKRGKGDKT